MYMWILTSEPVRPVCNSYTIRRDEKAVLKSESLIAPDGVFVLNILWQIEQLARIDQVRITNWVQGQDSAKCCMIFFRNTGQGVPGLYHIGVKYRCVSGMVCDSNREQFPCVDQIGLPDAVFISQRRNSRVITHCYTPQRIPRPYPVREL